MFVLNIVCHFVGYESSRELGTNWSKVGTKRLSLDTNRLGTRCMGTKRLVTLLLDQGWKMNND